MKVKLQNAVVKAVGFLSLFFLSSIAKAEVLTFEELKAKCQEMESNSQVTPFTSEVTCKQRKSTWVKTEDHSFPVTSQAVVRVKADIKDGQMNSEWIEIKSCDKETKYGKCSTAEKWNIEAQFNKTIRSCEELKAISSEEEYCRENLVEVMNSCEEGLVEARMNGKEPCNDVCRFEHKETLSCVDKVSCPVQQVEQKEKVEPAHDCTCDSSSSSCSSSDCQTATQQATQQSCPSTKSKNKEQTDDTSSSSDRDDKDGALSVSHSSSEKSISVKSLSLSSSSSQEVEQGKVVVSQESVKVILAQDALVVTKYRKSTFRQNYKVVQFKIPPTQGSIWCQMGFKQGSYIRKISGNRVKTTQEAHSLIEKAFKVGSIKVKGVIDGQDKTFISYREPDSETSRWSVVEQ